jgi:hypothetical protein
MGERHFDNLIRETAALGRRIAERRSKSMRYTSFLCCVAPSGMSARRGQGVTTIGHPRTVSGGRSGPPAIAAECLFVDPISDLAVLGPPDNQGLSAEYEAYEKLMAPAAPLSIAPVPGETSPGWLLSLDGAWFPCSVSPTDSPLGGGCG